MTRSPTSKRAIHVRYFLHPLTYSCVCVCLCVQVQIPVDYYDDLELAVFHEVMAKEACMRKCREKEVIEGGEGGGEGGTV